MYRPLVTVARFVRESVARAAQAPFARNMEALGLEEDSKSLAVPGSKDEDKAAKHNWEEEPGRNRGEA